MDSPNAPQALSDPEAGQPFELNSSIPFGARCHIHGRDATPVEVGFQREPEPDSETYASYLIPRNSSLRAYNLRNIRRMFVRPGQPGVIPTAGSLEFQTRIDTSMESVVVSWSAPVMVESGISRVGNPLSNPLVVVTQLLLNGDVVTEVVVPSFSNTRLRAVANSLVIALTEQQTPSSRYISLSIRLPAPANPTEG